MRKFDCEFSSGGDFALEFEDNFTSEDCAGLYGPSMDRRNSSRYTTFNIFTKIQPIQINNNLRPCIQHLRIRDLNPKVPLRAFIVEIVLQVSKADLSD